MVDPNQFEEMDLDEQIKVFAVSPISERGELILHSHEPGKIIQSLSSEELYLITREMDSEERSEILKFAHLRQLSFVADIDCWQGDRVNGTDFVRWLDTLREADERQLLLWMEETDYDGLIAGFMQFVSVLKPTWEYAIDEVIGDRSYFSLDQQYYILVEEDNFETVRRSLELIFEHNRKKYVAIMEGLMSEMEYEIEEAAYRRREIRLSDAGFPDLESAQKVYIPIDEETFYATEKKVKDEIYQQAGQRLAEEPRANYPVLWQFERIFLDEAMIELHRRDVRILEGVYEELAWLSNKLIVCHGMDFTSEEKVKWAVQRTRSLMNFSLDVLAEGDVIRAADFLEKHWLESIFRFGLNHTYAIGSRARALIKRYWKNEKDDLLAFMEAPYDAVMEGLLEKVPRCYDFEVRDNVQHLRDFSNRTDLARADMSIRQMECIHEFLKKHIEQVFVKNALEYDDGEVETPLFESLGTAFVNNVLRKKPSLKLISKKDIQDLISKAFVQKEHGFVLSQTVKDDFLTEYFPGNNQDLVRPIWGILFQQLTEQINSYQNDKDRELYYFTCLKHAPKA